MKTGGSATAASPTSRAATRARAGDRFGERLPTGLGLLTFRNLAEAVAGVAEIDATMPGTAGGEGARRGILRLAKSFAPCFPPAILTARLIERRLATAYFYADQRFLATLLSLWAKATAASGVSTRKAMLSTIEPHRFVRVALVRDRQIGPMVSSKSRHGGSAHRAVDGGRPHEAGRPPSLRTTFSTG